MCGWVCAGRGLLTLGQEAVAAVCVGAVVVPLLLAPGAWRGAEADRALLGLALLQLVVVLGVYGLVGILPVLD